MDQQTEPLFSHQDDHSGEREALVRFCHHLIGEASVAEDCTQETLIRAWQHADQLRDPTARSGWLKAIARNVCRRWLRDHRTADLTMPDAEADGWDGLGRTEPADAFDLEVELDRQELASLLDRAMALLPGETRDILVERFVRESPLAETARRLGLSEGAVTMRLQRGKLALRRVLVNVCTDELASFGINVGAEGEAWQPTRIWCPWCGRERLQGILARNLGLFRLRCPTCGKLNDTQAASVSADAAGYRGALADLLAWCDQIREYSYDHNTIACPGCGRTLALRKDARQPEPLVSYYCSHCHCGTWNGQQFNLLALPEARQFWKSHPRMRFLPPREVEADGRRAIVTGFASVTGAERLDLVYARDDLRMLRVEGSRGARIR